MLELITVLDGDHYVNDLTKEMDKHLLPEWVKVGYLCTYLWRPFKQGHTAVRFPGATRGSVIFDDNMIITEIILNSTASENCVRCYQPSVHDAVKKYIGAKIVLKE